MVKNAQGQSYYIVADAAWTLLANVPFCSTPTDDTCNRNDNIAYYFKERAAAGFNTALVALACDTYITCVTTWDRLTRGLLSWLTHWHPTAGTGAAYDGTLPFTGSVSGCSPSGSWPCWNLADPNPRYFAELVQLVNVAAHYGMQVGIVPINNNQCEPSYGQQDLKNNTTAAISGFGSYLASKFKSLPNVIWFEGNDYNCYTTPADDNPNYSIATNIISGGDSHLQTLEVGNGEGAASLTDVTNSWSSVLGNQPDLHILHHLLRHAQRLWAVVVHPRLDGGDQLSGGGQYRRAEQQRHGGMLVGQAHFVAILPYSRASARVVGGDIRIQCRPDDRQRPYL